MASDKALLVPRITLLVTAAGRTSCETTAAILGRAIVAGADAASHIRTPPGVVTEGTFGTQCAAAANRAAQPTAPRHAAVIVGESCAEP
jgi:hypothetical protein